VVVPNDAALLSGLNVETQLGSLVGLGSAVVTLTSQVITGSTGTLAPADVMGLTGISATASVGTVDPKDQVMGLTGQSATVSVGAVDVIAYANIDTGSNTSYSNISTGSNTSYSDVATGSNTSYNDVTGEAA
jgi:hypothetical protein